MLIQEKKIWTPDNSSLLLYKEKCECGIYVIGQDLALELQNLNDDLHDDRYFYDTEKALLRMDFMENCVRLTKDPFYNKPMVLMDWQKALIETMYSFKMSDTELERFKKILLLIARKNTKSETCSALAMGEFETGNPGSDIVCSSNDDSQASITFDAIDLMRKLVDPDDLDSKRNQRFILNKVTNTKIFKMSDRTRNKEGRNINFAIVDETHEMQEDVIGKSIEQSQSLKENPKFINITTEGFVVDGYLDNELIKARKIIYGEDDSRAAERFLPWLYTQDSEQEVWEGNRENRYWMKSNPTLGIVKRWDYLEEQIDVARDSKPDRIFVLSKDFNIKQNGVASWLDLEDYTYKAVFDLEEFRGNICIGGVDLSETTDLCCAKILLMKPGDLTKYIHTHYWIPRGKLEESDDKSAGAKYKEWAKAGLMTITEGNDIELSLVADWFYKLYLEWDIRLWKCGYDQRFSKEFLNRMEHYGWTKGDESMILILQNAQTLSNAMKLVEADLKHQLINYNENEVDRWCYKNAGVKVDDYGQCLCVKSETAKRIDGAVTTIILYETFRRNRTEYRQIIENRNKRKAVKDNGDI